MLTAYGAYLESTYFCNDM